MNKQYIKNTIITAYNRYITYKNQYRNRQNRFNRLISEIDENKLNYTIFQAVIAVIADSIAFLGGYKVVMSAVKTQKLRLLW